MNETPAPTTGAHALIVTEGPQAEADIAAPKQQMAASGLTVAQLISTARAAGPSFRFRNKRGGATGARIRLEPQRSWEVTVHMLAGMP